MARKSIPDEQLQTVKCPVLLLRGSEDTIVSPERACEEWRRSVSFSFSDNLRDSLQN